MYSKDQRRNQPNADPNTGNQMTFGESPDMMPGLHFSQNTLEHVTVPDIAMEKRYRSDIEKERSMQAKFGALGPGETPQKNFAGTRKDMLEKTQDIDGLPWEVRWKKTLIPTPEEAMQDVRDRFDQYIMDPIEREVEWYLHWKDRSFRIQRDRAVWPQGFTDYLDHYDQNGRRRVLPSDQKWSNTSWKYLADANYKNRMWLVEGEERKAAHLQLADMQQLIDDEERRHNDTAEVTMALAAGNLDLDDDQVYQKLSGTADPQIVEKTKQKIRRYGAEQALLIGKSDIKQELDPVTGFPKSDMEPLPTGITVEQAAYVSMHTEAHDGALRQKAMMDRDQGIDPHKSYLDSHASQSRKAGDRPVFSAIADHHIEKIQLGNAALQQQAIGNDGAAPLQLGQKADTSPLGRLLAAVGEVESAVISGAAEVDSPADGSDDRGVETRHHENAEGFIAIGRRPESAEPKLPAEFFYSPLKKPEDGAEELPEWYRQQVVDTQPLIRVYGMVGDPLEMSDAIVGDPSDAQKANFYNRPLSTSSDTVLDDDYTPGSETAFDEAKLHKLKTTPELVHDFQPLPLFRQAAEHLHAADPNSSDSVKRSQKLRKERIERRTKGRVDLASDVMLPDLPWEGESIADPYRGVANDDDDTVVPFVKGQLEAVWNTYRGFILQLMSEFGRMITTGVTSEENCLQMLIDGMNKVRMGAVGDHPQIEEVHLEVIKLVFEAQVKQVLGDFLKSNNRAPEGQLYVAEGEDMIKKATAKSKLLGKAFLSFIQEMSARELENTHKNPVQTTALVLYEKKLEVVARQFSKWVQNILPEFANTEFPAPDPIELQKDSAMRALKDYRANCPSRIAGVDDSVLDSAVEALYSWCAGMLQHATGQHYMRLFLHLGETQFRGKAEHESETATEYFRVAYLKGRQLMKFPVPGSEPQWQYEEKEFLDGENAAAIEMSGNLEKAESLWHSGSTKRWYPITDELEFMWFCERRGRYTTAMEVSDRCLEALNKRTHPSIHPFPDRARKFLEGAPLTQETAEHLWLQHMADSYVYHSEFMSRMGRAATAVTYMEKALNLYHLALRTAKERLPPTFVPPLLTKAKYLMVVSNSSDLTPQQHILEVDDVVNRIFAMDPLPAHWENYDTGRHYRLSVVEAALTSYANIITTEAQKICKQPSLEELHAFLALRARGGEYTHNDWFSACDTVTERVYRSRILAWRSKEVQNSDAFHYWTFLYFTFRIHVFSPTKTQELWELYGPTYDHIVSMASLGQSRGTRILGEAIRRLCLILASGSLEHKQLLLEKLSKARERMAHIVSAADLDKTINSLQANITDSKIPVYVYGTAAKQRQLMDAERRLKNPVLKVNLAARDYTEILERTAKLRAGAKASSADDMHGFQNGNTEISEHNPTEPQTEPTISTRKVHGL